MIPHRKLHIEGRNSAPLPCSTICSPWDGSVVATMEMADQEMLETALNGAVSAWRSWRHSSRYLRSRVLQFVADKLIDRQEELVKMIVDEAGKPKDLARIEIQRAANCFHLAAQETLRFSGEVIPADISAATRFHRPAITEPTPRGPVLAITPFNFPLNLAAHKVAPAIAAGTSTLLKPPPQAPSAAWLLAEIVREAASTLSDEHEQVPPSLVQVLNTSNEVAAKAVSDSRTAILSFTGSDAVGWRLQSLAQRKKVLLELGGTGTAIVDRDTDLAYAAKRCAFGAFAYAGQICISVQHILVEASVYEAFKSLLLQEVLSIATGDPALEGVLTGPVIDSAAVARLESWLAQAVDAGAAIISGGTFSKACLAPTLLESVPADTPIHREEVFGPIATLGIFSSFDDVAKFVNGSRYGLQAGLFTQRREFIEYAFANLEVGGLVINDIPTFRADHLPYGGFKDSGLGREGIRFAMNEFTELKTLINC